MLKVIKLALACVVALGIFSGLAHAATAPKPLPLKAPAAPNGNTTFYRYQTGEELTQALLQRKGYTPPDTPSDFEVLMNKKGYTPKGREYPIQIVKTVPKAALAKAVAKTLPVVGNILAMKELLDTLYGENVVSWDSSTSKWQKGVAVNWYWSFGYPGNVSPQSSCYAYVQYWNAGNPGHPSKMVYVDVQKVSDTQYSCVVNEMRGPTCYECPRTFGSTLYQEAVGGPAQVEEVTESEVRQKLDDLPVLPLAVDDLIYDLPPEAVRVLAEDIAADGTNKTRAVPLGPTGIPSTGLVVPESTSTTTGTDAQGRPQTIVKQTDTVVKQNPDGSLQHDERTTTTTTTQTGVGPNGEPITETSTSTSTTETTPSTSSPDSSTSTPSQEVITCGLPDTPACKIDETGTPEADPAKTQEEIDSIFGQVKTCLQDIKTCLPSLPNLSWSFALPTGCSALSFDTLLGVVVPIDMCQYQPTIHDLMSMLWAAAGLFGAVALVSRFSSGGP